jgi:hypothetical protein
MSYERAGLDEPWEPTNVSAGLFVQYSLDLANWRESDGREQLERAYSLVCFGPESEGDSRSQFDLSDFPELPPAEPGISSAVNLQQRLKVALDEFLASTPGKRRALHASANAAVKSVIVMSKLHVDDSGRLSRIDRYLPGPVGAVGLLLAFLLDPRSTMGSALRKCGLPLPDCGRYFLAAKNPSGGPRPKYCPGTDHQKMADLLRAPQRMRETRRAAPAKHK